MAQDYQHHHHQNDYRSGNAGGSSYSGGHRHHHRTVRGRIRSWLRHHRWFWPTLILVLAAAAVFGIWIYRTLKQQSRRSVRAGQAYSSDENTGYQRLSVNGISYRYKTNVRTVMLMALDPSSSVTDASQLSEEDATEGYSLASVQLLVLDPEAGKMSVLSVPPAAQIPSDSASGGTQSAEILTETDTGAMTLADIFAERSSLSEGAAAVEEGVSQLLGGIPVSDYIVLNMDTIRQILDSLGSLSVTVPTDDLSEADPEFAEGNTVDLTSENVLAYLSLSSNQDSEAVSSRMLRIASFSNAYILRLKEDLRADHQSLWNQMTAVKGTQFTSISASGYIGLASRLLGCDYKEDNYQIAQGDYEQDGQQLLFVIREDDFLGQILELFYTET